MTDGTKWRRTKGLPAQGLGAHGVVAPIYRLPYLTYSSITVYRTGSLVSKYSYHIHDRFIGKILVVAYTCQMFAWSLWWRTHYWASEGTECWLFTHKGTQATRLDLVRSKIIVAIRLAFVTFADIRRNKDRWWISIHVDNISAVLIIQECQMFVKEMWVWFNLLWK
jgi:hypothetical protein